jgi:hypothetical protein
MEELDQAATPEEETPVVEESAPLEVEETEQQETQEPEANEEEAPQDDSQAKEDSKGDAVQKRINEITAKRRQAERENQELKSRLDALEQKQAQATAAQGPPKLEDFDYDDEAFNKAQVDYQVNQKLIAAEVENQRKQAEQQKAKADADFVQRVKEANIEGFEDVVGNLVDTVLLPSQIVDAIQSDEKGPELVFYLGQHLDKADEIVRMPPVQAALELGKISAKLGNMKPTKKTTKAPSPPPTITGGGGISKEPADMSMDEVMRAD